MGSTTSPEQSMSHAKSTHDELRNLLHKKDQEIQELKCELDKYKLALQESQLRLEKYQRFLAATNIATTSSVGRPIDIVGSIRTNDDSGFILDDKQPADEILIVSPDQSSHHNVDSSSTPTRVPSRSSKVLFKTGEDSEDNHSDIGTHDHEVSTAGSVVNNHDSKSMSKSEENIDDIIHDVGEIDLDLELCKAASRKSSTCPRSQSIDENDDDEDVISDELLTSLTEAAMSNLSQLAALQERCESQVQHSHKYQHPAGDKQSSKPQQMSRQQSSHSSSISAGEQSTSVAATPISPQNVANPLRLMEHRQSNTIDFAQDPFSSVSISNQAAIAISAAAAAAAATVSTTPSSMIVSSSCQPQSSHQPVPSSSSVSHDSPMQSDLTTTNHSLASVVAAAAVAAAAANDQQQHSHLISSSGDHHQSRLVSSSSPSQNYYQTLHHHHQQQPHYHQQHAHGSPLPSALSSLHFSSSTSMTPSPCSLIGTSQSTRRSNLSNASSSIVSPTLPSYLRRQLIPSSDRLPSMSPSPSSGMATGTSSAASSCLAQILHHHHQNQQRSASALAGGPISSSPVSGAPLSGTGSSAVSPLISNKNSSQARLNNMQIRHKFGYLGSGKAQFNSPHGFCLGLNQEIVVADTNNHRVCIFDKSGTYITQFGSPGKEEGQLWNPRKVAILHRPTQSGSRNSGSSGASGNNLSYNLRPKSTSYTSASPDQSSGQLATLNTSEPLYVVCDRGAERSRMQLFTKDGAFIKKIGIHYIDIVAGLAITQNGLIIVVDSVSPTVYIINGETGILNGWFDCSGYMKEPSDIAVKSDVPGNEYFICDFKGHCVVVFNEQGEYLRKIGHDGLTSYPNGIDISDDGDILVGDSHGNRFHVVVFDRNGNFVSQFECPHVKVSRCCGLKITREGYIVTLAKNNHHVLVLDTIHI